MVDRMMRAVRADVELYEEVERNPSYTQEAYTIVGIVTAISLVISLLSYFIVGGSLVAAIWGGIGVFIGYFAWAYLTYFIGTRVFNGTADFGELQRTLGYAYTPQVLTFIPCVGFLAALWSLYLGFVAVRQALDIDNTKALLTVGISFLAVLALTFGVTFLLTGVGAVAGGVMGQ